MSEDAPTPADTVDTPATPVHDEYLTSGDRFVRWNLVSLVIGLVCLAAGALFLSYGS